MPVFPGKNGTRVAWEPCISVLLKSMTNDLSRYTGYTGTRSNMLTHTDTEPYQTRMHSSRMRTARLLTISQHAPGRMCIPACTGQKGVSARVGGVCLWGVCPGGCLPGGVRLGGVCPWGCLPGSVCPGGVYRGGGCLPGGGGRQPPVDRMTDRCKNITLLQLRCRQ